MPSQDRHFADESGGKLSIGTARNLIELGANETNPRLTWIKIPNRASSSHFGIFRCYLRAYFLWVLWARCGRPFQAMLTQHHQRYFYADAAVEETKLPSAIPPPLHVPKDENAFNMVQSYSFDSAELSSSTNAASISPEAHHSAVFPIFDDRICR